MTSIVNAQRIPIETRRALLELERRIRELEEVGLTDKILRAENEILKDAGPIS